MKLSRNEVMSDIFVYSICGYVLAWSIIVRSLREYYWAIPGYEVAKYLTQKYIHSVLRKENIEYEKFGTGRMLSIFEKWIHVWYGYLTSLIVFMVKFGIIGVFICWRMYVIGDIYVITIVVVTCALIGWIYTNNKKALKWKKVLKESETRHTKHLVKIFMSKFEILQNKKSKQEEVILGKNFDEQYIYAERRNEYLSLMYDVPYFLILWVIATFLLLTHIGFLENTKNSIDIITISILALSLFLPFIDFIKDLTKEFMHVEKLWDFIDNTPEIVGYDTGEKFSFKRGNYWMKNLSFFYRNSAEVLTNFSLTIEWWKRTALVGRSWSGKTTLMKLLAGYMRPTGWTLSIDEQDVTAIRLDSYYPHIGYLTQEPSVFDGTIEENLLYGAKKEPSPNDIKQAIELAECQFIYELEHGINTEIGERWVRLSGWQKQRLAIAKIFLKDPEIILLDEPTAALDSYSEEKVAQAFEHLFEGRTVIVIAHRLQTVKSADDIIVIERGKIVERGTHEELLKLGKKYAGMVDLQSGLVIENEEK